jgi:para-aminobenzoate synthetase component 1
MDSFAGMPPIPPLAEEIPWREPWDMCGQLAHMPHLLFLDSAVPHARFGRYSFVTADPFLWLTARGRQARAQHRGPDGTAVLHEETADPFTVLGRYLQTYSSSTLPGLPSFQGGAAGLFGYGLGRHIERLPLPRQDEFAVPEMAVGFYDWVISFDHAARRAWLVSTGFPGLDSAERRHHAAERRTAVIRLLAGPRLLLPPSPTRAPLSREELAPCYPLTQVPGLTSDFSRPGYLEAVQRVIDYIHAGDCFQVNLAQRLLYPAKLHPLELYGRLRERNPAPFAGYFDMGEFVLASASPERFLHVEDRRVETHPIKGTRPRSPVAAEDERQRRQLLGSAKDRAENVMIIDLLRNDLGRVCSYGSVEVTAVCRLESFRTVHHLVSEVRGRLRPEMSLIDLLRAAFPGGSVTGAPKVRAMEIIAELEPVARGPYCGSLGYLGFDGSMDSSILIRTFTHGRGWLQMPVGGGIVADSTPAGEYEETLHKAEGLLRALRD